MFEIRLAEQPFDYDGVEYRDYYNYFVLIVESRYSGILEFDLMNQTLKRIALDDPSQFYDVFMRSALHYFSQKGYTRITLEGPDFDSFRKIYLFNGVFEGDQILLEPFFNTGCGCQE